MGFTIELSGSHPRKDICDKLQGDYPKTFMFEGWHPQCFCVMKPIMPSDEEMERETDCLLNGEEYVPNYKPITETPPAFNEWVKENEKSINKTLDKGTAPFFVEHNLDIINEILKPKKPTIKPTDKPKDEPQPKVKPSERKPTVQKDESKVEPNESKKPKVEAEWKEEQISEIKEAGSVKTIERGSLKESLIKTVDDVLGELGENAPKTIQGLKEAMSKFKYTDEKLVEKQDEINASMKKLFDENDYGIDIEPDIIESVIKKGFLNTFQTGTSEGSLFSSKTNGIIEDDNERLIISNKMFFSGTNLYTDENGIQRYRGKQLERGEFEKYGHVLDKDKYICYKNNLSDFGSVQVRFKKEKVVCTWTFNDSLREAGEYFQPSLVTDPKICSFDRLLNVDIKSVKNWNSVSRLQEEMQTRYIELQFHGKLDIGMVESMTFEKNPTEIIPEATIEKLQDLGIELWYIKDNKAVLFK